MAFSAPRNIRIDLLLHALIHVQNYVQTPAGLQGQVDFGRFVLPWGHRYALVVVLSYSRLLWLRFYRSQTMTVLTSGLERAFERFGDVPDELRPPAGSEWTSKPAIRGKLPPPPEGFKGSGQLDVAGLWEMSITRAADYALQTP